MVKQNKMTFPNANALSACKPWKTASNSTRSPARRERERESAEGGMM